MQLADVPKRAVVQAARDGDPVALDELVSGYLPLVYNVVGRAADADLDVDDTVQDTMLQVVAGLPGLRDIGSARSWVLAIAVHQLTDARRRAQARRTQQIPVAPDLFDPVDPASDFVSLFLLRGSLSREQREVTQAARWLDPGYRDLLSGWWLEVAGELGRGDLAAAFGQSNGTLAVQVKRMRTQLDTCRSVVRALASSSCPDLAWSVVGWDGAPAPLWRKRIARHVRDCPTCSSFSARLVPPERLLASLGVVPVPVALAAAVRMAAASAGGWRVVGPGSHATGASGQGPGAGMQSERSARSERAARSAQTTRSARIGLHLGAGTGLKLAAAAAVLVLAAAGAAGYCLAGTKAPAPKTAPTAAAAAGSRTGPAVSSQAQLAQRGHRQPPAATRRHTVAPTATTALAVGPVFSSVVPPVPAVASVTRLGAIRQNARVAGRDNGQSAAYEGKSVWIFDDTTLKNPWGFLSNSGAATTDLDAANGITLTSGNPVTVNPGQTPVQLIPLTSAERAFEAANRTSAGCTSAADPYCGATFAFWPGPVVADPARGRILFMYGKLCRGGAAGTPCSGPLGKGLGTGIAAINMSTGQVTRLTATNGPDITSVEGRDDTMFFPASTGYSAAALVTGGELYAYGDCAWGCRVARVPLAQVSERPQWRFYAGSGAWSSDPADGVGLISPGGAGQTVFYDGALRAWVNIFMPYLSGKIMYQVGGSPYGPWSTNRTAAATPGGPAGSASASAGTANYALFAHPEYAQDGGLVEYLSYFRPGDGSQQLVRLQFAASAPGR
jgi:RNA polymerase sigma factor (sigma-70 family)